MKRKFLTKQSGSNWRAREHLTENALDMHFHLTTDFDEIIGVKNVTVSGNISIRLYMYILRTFLISNCYFSLFFAFCVF